VSTPPALPLSNAPGAAYPGASIRTRLAHAGLSMTGVVLLGITLSVMGSGSMSFRPEIFGLAVHPYLIPVAVAFPLVVLARIGEFPPRILAALVVFSSIYCFSVLSGAGMSLSEILKMVSTPVTIIVCALLVRRQGDFVAAVLGLTIAVAFMAVRAFGEPERAEGLQIMQGVANKNSYSMYALPIMLLVGYICLHMRSTPLAVKGLLVAGTIPMIVAIFMSGNRSGYLGVILVGLMLFWNRRGKGLLLVGAIAAIVVVALLQFGRTDVLEDRLKVTVEGYHSDTVRQELVLVCLQIGLENPIIGVSPQVLPFEIGRRAKTFHQGVGEAHNVFAHIIGGSGLICMAALVFLGWSLCSWKVQTGKGVNTRQDPLREARRLMRMLVFLWVVRGMFSAEILFNPSFNMAIGLAIGHCLLVRKAQFAEGAARGKSVAGTARLAPSLSPEPRLS
jgi:hypothetical protein